MVTYRAEKFLKRLLPIRSISSVKLTPPTCSIRNPSLGHTNHNLFRHEDYPPNPVSGIALSNFPTRPPVRDQFPIPIKAQRSKYSCNPTDLRRREGTSCHAESSPTRHDWRTAFQRFFSARIVDIEHRYLAMRSRLREPFVKIAAVAFCLWRWRRITGAARDVVVASQTSTIGKVAAYMFFVLNAPRSLILSWAILSESEKESYVTSRERSSGNEG